jgi:hypothetical protein
VRLCFNCKLFVTSAVSPKYPWLHLHAVLIVLPVPVVNEPVTQAAHDKHVPMPASLYVPALHSAQVLDAVTYCVPAAQYPSQFSGDVEPTGERIVSFEGQGLNMD